MHEKLVIFFILLIILEVKHKKKISRCTHIGVD